MPSLLDLSAELQLAIIWSLANPLGETTNDDEDKYLAFYSRLDIDNVSRCCRILRRLAAPILYRSIRLRNHEKSASSIQAIIDSPWVNAVRELNFEAHVTIASRYEGPVALSHEDFPHSVDDVLSHLERFPSLRVLSIQFKLGSTPEQDEGAARAAFATWANRSEPYRDFEELIRKEELAGWRAVMAKTYGAVCHSKRGGAFQTLELRNLLPSGVSSFVTEAWQQFLGTLKTLRLDLRANDDGACWQFNTVVGYIAFVENLDLLFSHLANVTHFSIAATECGPPGLPSSRRHAFVPLQAQNMPLLQVLELRYCFISKSLAVFITSHNRTLKQIVLDNCYSAKACLGTEEHTTWAAFLSTIADAATSSGDTPLEEVVVQPWNLGDSELVWNEFKGGIGKRVEGVAVSGRDEEVDAMHRAFDTDPHRRMFAYAFLDDKYGVLIENEERNLTAFLEGQDQAAFDRLMAVIDHNANTP